MVDVRVTKLMVLTVMYKSRAVHGWMMYMASHEHWQEAPFLDMQAWRP